MLILPREILIRRTNLLARQMCAGNLGGGLNIIGSLGEVAIPRRKYTCRRLNPASETGSVSSLASFM